MTKGKIGALSAIFVASVLLTITADKNSYLHTIAQYPALGSVFAFFGLMLFDEIRFQNELRKVEIERIGSLFAGGHFGSTIYDRHLQFCEEYWKRVLEIIRELFTKGQFKELVNRANALYSFRMEQAIWLTEDMNLRLEGFEQALRNMGADEHRLEHLPVGKQRSEVVDRSHDLFSKVLVIDPKSKENPDTVSYVAVLKELQKILGISEAYEFRKRTLEKIR